jgi:flagellar hook-associated protein 2
MASSVTGAGALSGASYSSSNSNSTTPGLGQGIDVNSFVQLALANDQANITNVQSEKDAVDAQSQALAVITSNLTALQSQADALNDPLGALNSQVATSSNSSMLTATASSAAVPAAHTVSITNLATTSSYYTDAVATSTTALATGDTVSISVGGTSVASLTVDSTNNTLDTLAAAINKQTNEVSATVINDANGARLALVSASSGAPGNISVTGTLHRTDTTAVAFHQAVAGTNAALTVDGVPISTASNTVTSVISGVTLNLAGPTGNSPVTLTVAPDTSKATSAINQFVSAYNTAINSINAQFQVGSDGTGGGPLEGDGSLHQAQAALLAAVTYSGSGTTGMANLASMGINLNNDGTLTVDQATLASVLSSNFSGFQAFFQAATTGFATQLKTAMTNIADPNTGTLGLDAQGLTQSSQAYAQSISDMQAALAVKQQNLIQVYAQVNATLQELPLLQAQLSQQLATA